MRRNGRISWANMFRECHCTGVVYNPTAMLSRTFHQFEKHPTFQLHFGNLHQEDEDYQSVIEDYQSVIEDYQSVIEMFNYVPECN